MRRATHSAAGVAFWVSLAALIPFWVVKGTEPAGHAALWALYGVLVASAVIWFASHRGLYDRAPKQAPGFPDVEIDIRGRRGDQLASVTPIFALHRVRITNHETDRAASLTFRLYAKLKPDSPWGMEEMPLTPTHPPRPPALSMPIQVGPQTSIAGDVEFDASRTLDGQLVDDGDPVRLEVEDHLSGQRRELPTMGRWRGDQS